MVDATPEPLAPCGGTWASLDAHWNAKGYTACPHTEETQ